MLTLKNTLGLAIYLTIGLLITSCAGSETYRGEWKATDSQGVQSIISFGENTFTVTVEGKTESYEYSQNSIKIQNSVETYGIKLDDGRRFQIHFPIGNDESKGAILDANGLPLYIIGRNAFIGYDDLYGI